MSKRVLAVARFTVAMLAAASPLFAATMTRLSDDALAPLRGASVLAKKIRLDKLPLYDSKRSVIELEEFQVWAPGAKVVIHGDNGVILEKQDPPPMRFYRGLVNGSRESFAYFSVDQRTMKVEGMIDTGEKKLAIASVWHPAPARRNRDIVNQQQFDSFLTDTEANEVLGQTTTWQCQVDKSKIGAPGEPLHATGINGLPVTAQGISGTQSYSITVEVETDYEMYHTVAGDNATTVTNYVTNLSGATSTIYNRDLKTNLVQSAVNVYTTIADPWSAVTSSAGLDELGDAYHNVAIKPSGRTTSAVIMLSGKPYGGGIAWEGVICGSDFFQGAHWGGPYAWCGGIGNLGTLGFGSIPDVITPPYTMPSSGTQSFWPLAEYAHELGHNLGGHHTHCVQTSDAERIAAGFTDGSAATSANDLVDHCYGGEGMTGCYVGTNYVVGSQTTFKGTIMSYCHNVSPQASQSRYTFGQPVEGSHNELDNYMLRTAGPLQDAINAGFDGGSRNIVNGVGAFTISAITAPVSVGANSAGNAASFTASPSAGATYAWEIQGGTIDTGQGTNSITFTAGASGTVALRATGYNTQRCGVTDTKSVAIVTVNPPTGVAAIATGPTSVSVTWNSATGAVNYQVFRSDGTGYVFLANSGGPTSYTDNAASTNKAYLYRVRSIDGASNASTDSNADFATVVVYTNTLSAGVSTIRAVDLTEDRLAVSAMRVLAGQGSTTYTNTITAGSTVLSAIDITELRTFLNGARTAMAFSATSFTNSITAGSTVISALDFNEIRTGAQ